MLIEFFEEMVQSINPVKYSFLSQKKPAKAIKFMTTLLFVCFILMAILYLPKISILQDDLANQMQNLDFSEVSGNWSTKAQIALPEKNPLIVIDTVSDNKINTEFLYISNDFIYYKFFGNTQKIKISDLKNTEKVKNEFSGFLFFLALLFLPYIIIIAYSLFFIKYLFITGLTAFIAWTLMDLTYFKIKLKQVFNTAIYGTVFLIPLEILSFPIGNEWLMNRTEIFRIEFFFLSTTIYLAFFLFVCIFLMINHRKTKEDDNL